MRFNVFFKYEYVGIFQNEIFFGKVSWGGNDLNKSSCIKLLVKVVQSMDAGNPKMKMLKGLPIICRSIQVSHKDTEWWVKFIKS